MNVVIIFYVVIILAIVIAFLLYKSNIFAGPVNVGFNNTNTSTAAATKGITEKGLKATTDNAAVIQNLAGAVNTPNPTWSKPKAITGDLAGNCLAYTFFGEQFVPASPSFSQFNANKNNFTVSTTNQTCIDIDQLYASAVSHECIDPDGVSAGSGCILTVTTVDADGTLKGPGEFVTKGTIEGDYTLDPRNEKFYTPCIPGNLSSNIEGSYYCKGNIGYIIPYFKPQSAYNSDVNFTIALNPEIPVTNPEGYRTLIMEKCDLTKPNQIFRIVKYSYNLTNGLYEDAAGNLAKIVHRGTGYYLAPKVLSEPITTTITKKVTSYNYLFDQMDITYHTSTPLVDKEGKSFKESVELILINPAYDKSRAGVYWLFQNRTLSSAIQPSSAQISQNPQLYERGFDYTQNIKNTGLNPYSGIYENQDNYATNMPQGIAETSYFFRKTFEYCQSLSGSNKTNKCGKFTPNKLNLVDVPSYSISWFLDNFNPGSGCFYKSKIIGYPQVNEIGEKKTYPARTTEGPVEGVDVDISPQQIVYVPDLRLLELSSSDTQGLWTYLVNSFSINVTSDNKTVLTPFKTTSKIDIYYGCIWDSVVCPKGIGNIYIKNYGNYCGNVFTYPYYTKLNRENLSDTQFIDYSNFIRQIQIGVTPNTDTTPAPTNPTFSSYSNPLNS